MLMKRLFIIFFSFQFLIASGQQYNNEWIDYGKTYYKFKVGKTGLFRIPQSTLLAAGIASADASAYQLWRNGNEVPIYTSIASGIFGAADYIEFWGEKNDGKADLPLYRDPNDQINDSRSLFTDTAAYFLTIYTGGFNNRLTAKTNNIPSKATPEPYCLYTTGAYYGETIHMGMPYGTGTGTVFTSSYEQGEGWASNDINSGQSRAYTESNLFTYTGTGAPDAQVRMNVVGNYSYTRNLQLSLNGTMVFDKQLANYDYMKLSGTVPVSVIAGNTANFSLADNAATQDHIRVAFIEMTYPRTFNFGGASNFRFKIPAKPLGTYLEISGFTFTGVPVLYDLANGKRYEVDATTPSLLKVFLLPSSVVQDLVLVNENSSNINIVTTLQSRNFVNYLLPENQGDYLMITNNLVLNASDGTHPVDDYKAYRSSAAGGGYNAKIYLIDQLIDQFAFGIKFDPLSVRNFIRFARKKFSVFPKQVFIVGKGVDYVASRYYESNQAVDYLNLIPTFGDPASDVLMAAEGSSSQPLTPIGRISVINGDELSTYLEKVKQYEQAFSTTSPLISESAWKKNVIHMVGANDQPTIDGLYAMLNAHKAIIQDTLVGANVVDFVKDFSTVAQQSTADRLANVYNNGVGLLTYFGHSSSSNLGFNMDDPYNYTNQGKYPVFNMMGCDAGDIYIFDGTRYSTFSEKFVLAKQRGCIAMMAGTSIGYTNTLDLYNQEFYKLLSKPNYSSSLGDLMKNTIANVYSITSEKSQQNRSQCEEYALNGDPALKLYHYLKPDYAIEDQLVTINPTFISIAEPNFKVHAIMMNLGEAVNQKIVIELKRTYPDMSSKVIRRDTIQGIRYIDSLDYTIPIDPVKDKGLNKITITIDPQNTIDELYKSNNSITKEINIYEDELRPIYPYNYAIINTQNIKLSASTADPLAPSRSYMMEIDTTALFNSPLKRTQTITSTGGVIEFTPGLTFADSTVYYWRVATTPASTNDQPKWNKASFVYINGAEVGYNQSHYYQFLDNSYFQIQLDSTTRQLNFNTRINALVVNAGVWGTAATKESQLTVEKNDYVFAASACGFNLVFNVLDGKSFDNWVNSPQGGGGLYNSNGSFCASTRYPNFEFSNTSEGRNRAYQFLQQIPDGNYVIMRPFLYGTNLTALAPQWKSDQTTYGVGNTLYDELVRQGFNTIDSFYFNRALIFVYKKNDSKTFASHALFSPGAYGSDGLLSLTLSPTSIFNNGTIESQTFGPAKEWKQFIYDGVSKETPMTDSITFDIIGVKSDLSEQQIFSGINPATKKYDISTIDANVFPYLKLRIHNADMVNYSPYQLKYWRLYYTPMPEGAVAPNLYFAFKDTLDAGEPLNFGVAFKNVSSYNFDSLGVKLTVRNASNVENVITVPKQKALVANDTLKFNIPVGTKQYLGKNTAYIEFNPNNLQPEQYHFNNFIYKDFYVRKDTLNPYMDVTFDGVHILNKDIVSSKPDILIKVTDQSKWLLLNNPDMVKVQLKYPDGTLRDFSFNSDTLVFTPATQGSNSAIINFKPSLLTDGNYELIVTAKDQSGNSAGQIEYRVAFQVENKPAISNLLNYPNPFTTSTAFVFTLTGSDVPQNIRIQILTITGKIVKEITKEELGPLRIGRNITEYKWNGTDQYGQKLGNGVYLYRVLTNLNGKSLDKYKSSSDNTDKYFNKGYGKMYLMR
jgi:hypothetical protein